MRLECTQVCRRCGVALILIIAVGLIGCQRSYVESNDPRFPLTPSQKSTATWTNKKLQSDSKLKWLRPDSDTDVVPAYQ